MPQTRPYKAHWRMPWTLWDLPTCLPVSPPTLEGENLVFPRFRGLGELFSGNGASSALATKNHRGTRAIHAKGQASTGEGVSPIKMPPVKGKSKRDACPSSFEVFIQWLLQMNLRQVTPRIEAAAATDFLVVLPLNLGEVFRCCNHNLH